jgi:hypothetical protein
MYFMYKKLLFITIITFSFLAISHMLVLITIDPLSISRISSSVKEFYIKEMRFQAAGIINNIPLDSAIVGTSMAENFNASEASKLLGGNFVNLSLKGSLLKERKVVLKYLLSSHKIKTLIISLDGATKLQRNSGIPIDAWSYLYNDSYLDDLTTYTNRKYLPYINCHSFFHNNISAHIFGECPEGRIRASVDLLTEWQSQSSHNSRFGGIDKWKKHKSNAQVKASIEMIVEASSALSNNLDIMPNEASIYDYKQFNEHILPLVINHPDTKFILFFPPYSLVKYAIDYQTNREQFNNYKNLVKNIVLDSEQYENIELYWFNEHTFIEDIKNYKDLSHYNSEFNSLFLSDFSLNKSMIDSKNYKKHLQSLENRASKLDLIELAQLIKQ